MLTPSAKALDTDTGRFAYVGLESLGPPVLYPWNARGQISYGFNENHSTDGSGFSCSGVPRVAGFSSVCPLDMPGAWMAGISKIGEGSGRSGGGGIRYMKVLYWPVSHGPVLEVLTLVRYESLMLFSMFSRHLKIRQTSPLRGAVGLPGIAVL